jgi:hypothetical protein
MQGESGQLRLRVLIGFLNLCTMYSQMQAALLQMGSEVYGRISGQHQFLIRLVSSVGVLLVIIFQLS